MAQEQFEADQKTTHPASAHVSHQTSEQGTEEAGEHDALFQQYREPMLRIGQLEAQINRLTRRHQQSTADAHGPSEPVDEDQASVMRVVLPKIEDMERKLGTSPVKASSLDIAGDSTAIPNQDQSYSQRRDDEIAQLRFQIASLATKLARTEGRLKQVDALRAGRRVRNGHRPVWKFWRRRKRH